MIKIIKSNLKKILPKRCQAFLKMGKDFWTLKNRINNIGQSGVVDVLVGTPLHQNIGDHIIAEAEKQFLLRCQKEVIEIPMEAFVYFKGRIQNKIDYIGTVYISGGGWLGNLWPEDENNFLNMIKVFENKRIVVFPQTVYYDDSLESTLKKREKEVLSNKSDLYFCARERTTYDYAKNNYVGVNVYLFPDIAFFENFDDMLERKKNSNVVGVCLRNDREKDVDCNISDQLKQHNYEIRKVNTIYPHRVHLADRKQAISKVVRDFLKCNCVITDRLHAMILSAILGIPCIAIDNKTHKVRGIYDEWLGNFKWICFVEKNKVSEMDIENMINTLKIPDSFDLDLLRSRFDDMRQIV
ncbi:MULTISPECIES: polysaccharide pyruvyl transferase family protein [Butyrivibrio]|uniref:polysaccharide pyruvyl transferase family protein n=1 Tax=Butyrivibrio TaxID=830 RepID=UPI0008761D21|nr:MULTISPECIES: polysaccharide pyruvyl transferase family protein [Butyrivibrio]SCY42603.1 Exopolysaccharide biosynthesis protein EpsI, predicted pyruvyl transferase [Butyrivibrio sp. INlla14]